MNLGLTTSFIIGGLLMLAIVSLNIKVGQNNADMALHSMNQSNISAVSSVVMFDFPKIGYNNDGPIDDPILVAEKDEIRFLSNLKNDPGGSVQTVTWSLSDSPVSGSNNAKHRVLTRTIDGDEQEITLGVTRFELNYYTASSATPLSFPIDASTLEQIKRIEVILEMEPKEGTGKAEDFTTSSWRRIFTPPNLNLES